MKKTLLSLVLFTGLNGAFAQVQKLDAQLKRLSSINNAYLELFDKKRYDFNFKNMNTTEYEFVKFSFRGPKTSDYDDIYNIIVNGFSTAVTDEIVKIKSNNEVVGMKYINSNGERLIKFFKYRKDGVATSDAFTKEQITELFKK